MKLALVDSDNSTRQVWDIAEWQRSVISCLTRIHTLPKHEILPCTTHRVMCIVFYELSDFVEVDRFVKFWEAKHNVACDKMDTTAFVMIALDDKDLPDELGHLHAMARSMIIGD